MAEALVLVGGLCGHTRVDNVDCYVPTKNEWYTLAHLPQPVSHHGVVAIGQNSLLVAGGQNVDGSFSKSVWQYFPGLNTWNEAAPMSSPKRFVGLTTLNGFVYAIGGWDGRSDLTCVEKYIIERNEWSKIRPMKTQFRAPVMVGSIKDKIVVGGVVVEDNKQNSVCFECYEPRTDRWYDLPPMLHETKHSATCVVNDNLYTLGGLDLTTRISSTLVQ